MSRSVSAERPLSRANITEVNGDYVTTGEAARALGLHVRTLQKWRRDGLITPTTFTARGIPRWDIADLRAEIERMGRAADQRRRARYGDDGDQD